MEAYSIRIIFYPELWIPPRKFPENRGKIINRNYKIGKVIALLVLLWFFVWLRKYHEIVFCEFMQFRVIPMSVEANSSAIKVWPGHWYFPINETDNKKELRSQTSKLKRKKRNETRKMREKIFVDLIGGHRSVAGVRLPLDIAIELSRTKVVWPNVIEKTRFQWYSIYSVGLVFSITIKGWKLPEHSNLHKYLFLTEIVFPFSRSEGRSLDLSSSLYRYGDLSSK